MAAKHLRLLFLIWILSPLISSCLSAMTYVAVRDASSAKVIIEQAPSSSLLDVMCNVDMGASWAIKPGCTVRASGGIIKARTIIGNGTKVEGGHTQVFQCNTISGTWDVDMAYPEWFGISGKDKDWSPAIVKTLAMNPSEIRFTHGVYAISQPVVTTGADVCICKGATLKALDDLSATIDYQGKVYTVHSMILGNYKEAGAADVYGLETMPKIYGGGCIDGDYKAQVGIQLHLGFRTIIRDLCVKNVLQYGFVASTVPGASGNSFMEDCMFQNTDNYNADLGNITQHHAATAIWNNRSDCVYNNVEIVNFPIAVRHEGLNGNFTNVHAWLRDPFYWESSVVFDCYVPDITLNGCEADTMRKLLVNRTSKYFFANLVNCRAYNNPIVVSEALARRYPPLVVDCGEDDETQIMLTGGCFWYDTPYQVINSKSPLDKVSVTRFNRSKTNLGIGK